MPVNGLQHHDGIVHNDADHEHESEHGEDVHRVAHEVEHSEGADDGHRNSHRGNDRGPQIPEEDEDDEHHQAEGDGQRVPHLADGFFNIDAGVVVDPHLHPFRQGRTDGLHLGPDRLGHIDRVGFGLFDDAQENAGLARGPGDGAVIGDAVLGTTHILEAHQVGPFRAEHQVVEFLGGLHFASGLDGHLPVQVLHAPTGQFDVLLTERLLDVQHRHPPGGHPRRVEPQPHRVALLATNGDRRHAGDPLEARFDLLLREGGHLQRRIPLAVQSDPENGLRVGVLLGDDGLTDVSRQCPSHPGNPVPDILRRGVDVPGEVELHGDVADALATFTAEGLDTLDVVDGFLEPLRHLGLDHLSIGPGENRRHGDDGRINVWQLANGQTGQPDQPEEHQHQIHHPGQDRTLNGNARQDHRGDD